MASSDEWFSQELLRRMVSVTDENASLRRMVEQVTMERDESHRHAPLWSREKDQPQAQLLQPQDIVVDDDQDAPLGLQLVQLQDELEELTQTRAQADSLAVQLADKERELDIVRVEYDSVVEQLRESKEEANRACDELRAILDSVRAHAELQETSHHAEAKKVIQLTIERGDFEMQLNTVEAQLLEMKSRITTLTSENAALQHSYATVKSELETWVIQGQQPPQELDSANAVAAALQLTSTVRETQLTAVQSNGPQPNVLARESMYTGTVARSDLVMRTDISSAAAQATETQAVVSTVRQASRAPSASTSTQANQGNQSDNLVIRLPPVRISTNGTLNSKHESPLHVSSTTSRPLRYSTIPCSRRTVLEAFPVVTVTELPGDIVTFNRSELSAELGGTMQGVDGIFGKQKPIAITHDLYGCIYPQRLTNPWLPSGPGEHGYMFVGLEGPLKDHERFLTPTTRALFIPEGKSGWRYYGLYVIQRHPENDLTLDEWNALPDSFKDGKDGYCDTTLSKRMGKLSYRELVKRSTGRHEQELQKVRADYDSGNLRSRSEAQKSQAIRLSEESTSLGKRKRKTRDLNNPTLPPPSSSPQRPR